MKYSHNRIQKSLFSFGVLKIEIPEDHELVKMEREIDWDGMVEIAGKKYSEKTGRNSKSLRMMIGLEIAKRKYRFSDEDIVQQLKVDAALKIFCGFDEWEHEIPDASSLARFRARLDDEALRQMEEVNVKKIIRKMPRRNRYQTISDTTCVEANITYPTDNKLLAKTHGKLVEAAERIRKSGVELVIRGKRRVRKIIRAMNLKRKKTREEIIKINRKLLNESRKVICLLRKHLQSVEKEMRKKITNTIHTAEKILFQQKQLIGRGIRRVKNRIVSFHETKVRPIFRGKDGKQTEFGPKVAIHVIGGALVQTTKLSNDNFSDTEMISASLKTHRRTTGRDPAEVSTDRGAHSPRNHKLLKQKNITDGIQYRGKIPEKAKLSPPYARKRMYRQRSIVEGKIGTFKTAYGGHRNQYRNKNAQAWISFAFIAMNATWVATQ